MLLVRIESLSTGHTGPLRNSLKRCKKKYLVKVTADQFAVEMLSPPL